LIIFMSYFFPFICSKNSVLQDLVDFVLYVEVIYGTYSCLLPSFIILK